MNRAPYPKRRRPAQQLSVAELTGDPIVSAIQRLLAAQPDGEWCGSFTEAMAELNARTSEAVRKDPAFWPRNQQALSRRLNRMDDALRSLGVAVKLRRGGLCFVRIPARIAA